MPSPTPPISLAHAEADLYLPEGADPLSALQRTTHLAVGAHQDDLEFMAYHGIAHCYDHPEKWFGGVTVTDGGGSARSGEYAGYTDSQMKAVRREEQREAARLGRYTFQAQLAYPSREVKEAVPSVTNDLATIFQLCRPEVVYLHNPADKHPTHVAVFLRCLAALRRLPAGLRPKQVYGCEGWRDLDWLPDPLKVALPCDAHPELAETLVGLFRSQIAGGKRYDLAIMGRRRAHATLFHSHSVDTVSALTFALDLSPLVADDELTPEVFLTGILDTYREEVLGLLRTIAP